MKQTSSISTASQDAGPVEFSSWLLAQLEARGWTQSELARRSRISQPTLSRISTGTRQVGPDAALAIARALGESPVKVFRLAKLLSPALPDPLADDVEALTLLPPGPIRDGAVAAIHFVIKGACQMMLEHRATQTPEQCARVLT
jgi:transcriptional regulator with XRE-family HTH domain